jgi:toxin ParE1/3/4
MKPKPVVPRELANRDIQAAIDHYLGEAAEDAALGFVTALEAAFSHISAHPSSGATRYAHELELEGVRSWPLRGYPFLLFYIERADHIDLWRVLHGHRDLPEQIRPGGDP